MQQQMQSLLVAALGWLYRIVVFTDPAGTYANPEVQHFWGIALYITDLLAAIFFVFTAYQILFAGFSTRYAQVLEMLPRMVFVLVGAHMSLYLAGLVIDFNNDLCVSFLAQIGSIGIFTPTGTSGFLLPFLVLYMLLVLLLCLQMVARMAFICFLLAILPLLIILLANRSTEHVGRAGIETYLSTVFIQPLQLLTLVLGGRVLIPFLTATIGQQSVLSPMASLVIGIGIFWLALQLPILVGRIVLQPIARTGGGVLTVITSLVARLN